MSPTERAIEALLFAAAEPRSLADLARRLPQGADVEGALEALRNGREDVAEMVGHYDQRRRLLLAGYRSLGLPCFEPGGAFYIFPKVPCGTDQEFVVEAIRNELLIIPGSVFSEKTTHFRISYAAADETIARGIEVLRRLIEQGAPKKN